MEIVVRFDGSRTPARIARAICREVKRRQGDSGNQLGILWEANRCVFGGTQPPPSWTKRRAEILNRGWRLAEAVGFDSLRL